MKAAVYDETGGPEVLRYEDFPDPVCGPGDVLVRVEAISIEGGDTLNRAGGEMATTPHVVGYQCAGTIVEVGADVTDRTVGERVVTTFLWGSHAELRAVPAAVAWPVPDGADIVAIACVPIAFGTADDCLFEFGHLQAGETVLVHAAAGGVGIAAIQLAKRAGATVIATASSDERLERVRPLGIDHPVELQPRRLGRRGARRHRWPGRRSRGRLGRRADPRRQRPVPRVPRSAHQRRQRRPRSAAVRHLGALDGQPLAHRRVPRCRDHEPAHPGDDRRPHRRRRVG